MSEAVVIGECQRPPQWLLKSLEEVKARIEGMEFTLAVYRTMAENRPRKMG